MHWSWVDGQRRNSVIKLVPKLLFKHNDHHNLTTRFAYPLSAPAKNRLFEIWLSWKELKPRQGMKSYLIGFVPLSEYGHHDLGISPQKLFDKVQDLSGFHIITEVRSKVKVISSPIHQLTHTFCRWPLSSQMAPNICRYTRVQIIAMKLNVPKAVMGRIANSQLFNHGKSLEQKYKRNPAKVDAEVREMLANRIRQGVELEMDQKEVRKRFTPGFALLRSLFLHAICCNTHRRFSIESMKLLQQ